MLVALLVAAGILVGVDRHAVPDAALAALADRPAPAQGSVPAAASPPSGPVAVPASNQVPQASSAWVARTAASSGIPLVAVAAYGDAALRLGREQPGCHLGWSTLAGIGTVESANGTVGGRMLDADGFPSRPIIGPALDGTAGNMAIRDSAGGWTTARGPMQFLPSTWATWGADADGDGRASVDDIFDAALAAGRYLCADDHDLAEPQGWADAIFAYNHSTVYVQQVYASANAAAR